MSKKTVGKLGEEIAEKYLIEHGFSILDKNFQNRFGEIDIVATDGDVVVFVEVKTRYSDKYGKPEEAVTPGKIKKIIKAGQYYRNIKKNLPEGERIDVVAINLAPEGKLQRIELIKNVTS